MRNTNTPEQRARALEIANDVRAKKARFKDDVNEFAFPEGVGMIAALLEDPERPDWANGFKVYELLKAPHRMGHMGLKPIIRDAGIVSGDRKLRDLSQRQLDLIALSLRQRQRNYDGCGLRRKT